MTTLLEIIRQEGIRHNNKIVELQEFLGKNNEILIDKNLFIKALLTKNFVDIRRNIVYLILHHCIKHNSAISEKKERLLFPDVMNILDKAVHTFVTPEYFYKLINFRDQNGNTLLHQAIISNNTDAIEALLKHGANPLIKIQPLWIEIHRLRESIEC